MKRLISLILASVIMMFMFTACTEGNTPGGNKSSGFDEALSGVWYSAYDSAILNINADGTGTVSFEETSCSATFSAENGVFSATSDDYCFSGEYTLEGDQLILTVPYENESYTLVFTREKIVIPEKLKGGHVYKLGDDAYELNIGENITICKGLPYPPSENYPETEVYVIPVTTTESPTEANSSTTQNEPPEYKVFPKPPKVIFENNQQSSTSSEPASENSTVKATENATQNVTEITTDKKPDDKKDTSYVPDKVKLDDENVKVVKDDKEIETIKGGSIVGTWTSDKQDGYVYIFGYETTTPYTVTYTFNADGTGTVTALFFTGTVKWSLNGNRLDITVSMLGDTDSGSALVTIVGDVMYFVNDEDELYTLTKAG